MLEQNLRVEPVQTSLDRNSHLRKQETFIMTIFATNLKKIVLFWKFYHKKPENSQAQTEKICVKQDGVPLTLQFLGALDTCIWKKAVYTKKKVFERRKNNFRLLSQSLNYKNWRTAPETKDFQRQ